MTKWKELLIELNVDADKPSKNDINILETWYFKNISRQAPFDTTTLLNKKLTILQQEISSFLASVSDILPEKSSDEYEHLGGLNAIQYASKKGYDVYLSRILSINKNAIDTTTKGLLTPLHLAAYYGNHLAVQTLIDNGAKTNLNTRLQHTAAHIALSLPPSISADDKSNVIKRKNAILQALFKQDKSIMTWVDNSQNTLAHFAAENGFATVLESLRVDYPALLLMKNSLSHTPLHVALLNHQDSCIDELIRYEKLLSISDINQQLPIHYAAMHSNVTTLAKFVTNKHLDIRDAYLKTPLMLAAEQGNLDNVKLLIDKGSDVTLTDHYGRDAWDYAVRSRNLELIKWMAANVSKLDINHQDLNGRTALMNLLIENKTGDSDIREVVECLLEAGCKTEIVDKFGDSLKDLLQEPPLPLPMP